MDSAELTAGLREGNSEAWDAFFDEYYDAVCRGVARMMGGDVHDVADVVQETFFAAARSARQFDPARGTLGAWISGIARNRVALHFRESQRQQQVQDCTDRLGGRTARFVAWLDGGDVSPPDAAMSVELTEVIRATLLKLPDDYGELLTARYLDQLSVEQLAERSGTTDSAVRSRLARARRAFRQAFVDDPTWDEQ
ncbi:MAG: sigma-70 family RNA polymerase sigma factor [Planctomycetota bacterium]|nr:sigma-70 family RNA polymerase sigma factor [Planctomycetota bacterium]